MITITDNDLPITVAEKLIKAKCDTVDPLTRALVRMSYVMANGKEPTKEELDNSRKDMFTDDEIEEIAQYLMVYVKTHKETNDGEYKQDTRIGQED